VITPIFLYLSKGRPYEWFYRVGQFQYERMLANIMQNREAVTSVNSSLSRIVGRKGVYGMTNHDGSLLVWFMPVDGWPRGSGYFYYSGTKMLQRQDQTNQYYLPENSLRFYTRLTNGWYAFH
jgi:hypothetical protein